MRSEFPTVVDSTLIATLRSCPAKARMAHFDHWKPIGDSVHLVAGKAYADGLEAARRHFFETGDSETALAAGGAALLASYGDFVPPAESAKSPQRMLGALEYYFAQYGWSTDEAQPHVIAGEPCIEFSFAEPLPVLHPETNEPLIYAGRADMIVQFAGGLWVLDDKTTSSLGASWRNQWELRSQFTAYTWAAQAIGINTTGVLVRGVSILKTKYDTQQVFTNRHQWEVDRWLEQVCRDLERAKTAWRSGIWDYNLDQACTEYGGCQFTSVCKSPEPENWLPVYFQRRKWNPLTRTETLLDTTE